MKIGYARVSTKDQNLGLQIDALTKAGCEKIYQDIASGARSERPALNEMIHNLRPGDVLVIWKLDRLGRSLNHLISLVNDLMEKKIGLQSLHDPIDTTTAQGRLSFNLFASLAEFERDLIRERTQAGLSAARARGRNGGRPKGIPQKAGEFKQTTPKSHRILGGDKVYISGISPRTTAVVELFDEYHKLQLIR